MRFTDHLYRNGYRGGTQKDLIQSQMKKILSAKVLDEMNSGLNMRNAPGKSDAPSKVQLKKMIILARDLPV